MGIEFGEAKLHEKEYTVEEQISMLSDEIARLRNMVVSVSLEEEWPEFRQGEPTHEVEAAVTADLCTKLVDQIKSYKTEIAWHDTIVESLRETIESLQLDANAREEQ